jgi:hypothetical protein
MLELRSGAGVLANSRRGALGRWRSSPGGLEIGSASQRPEPAHEMSVVGPARVPPCPQPPKPRGAFAIGGVTTCMHPRSAHVVRADRGHRPRPGSSAEQARSRDHDARDERGQTAEQHDFLENTSHHSPALERTREYRHRRPQLGTGFFVPSIFKVSLNGDNISRCRLGIRHSQPQASPISTILLSA